MAYEDKFDQSVDNCGCARMLQYAWQSLRMHAYCCNTQIEKEGEVYQFMKFSWRLCVDDGVDAHGVGDGAHDFDTTMMIIVLSSRANGGHL